MWTTRAKDFPGGSHIELFDGAAPVTYRDVLDAWQRDERFTAWFNSLLGTMEKRISDRAVWLSTAGAGVPALHMRLDDRPKYYHYDPYRPLGPGQSLERMREV